MKKKIKLKKKAKDLIVKYIILLIFGIADVIIYHFLANNGSFVGVSSWGSAFILIGWFWLLLGQFMALYSILGE